MAKCMQKQNSEQQINCGLSSFRKIEALQEKLRPRAPHVTFTMELSHPSNTQQSKTEAK